MALIDHLWFATLTKNEDDAGSENLLNLTINIDGIDVVDTSVAWMLQQAEAYFLIANRDFTPFDSNDLTNSSIRLGIRGDDCWVPQHILIFGHAQRLFVPLAIETDLDTALSTDTDEGHLTMPLRLVSLGSSLMLIRRVLLLVDTSGEDNAGTDSPIQLEITAAGSIALQQQIPDTAQSDEERFRANWYFLDVPAPFTKSDVISNGGITLSILGTDAWLPDNVVLFGLDTESGRPTEMVPLVAVIDWKLGWLSADPHEGKQSMTLPLV
jgi:hypothetical protein